MVWYPLLAHNIHNFPEILGIVNYHVMPIQPSCYAHTTMYIYAVLLYYGANLARMLGTVGSFAMFIVIF